MNKTPDVLYGIVHRAEFDADARVFDAGAPLTLVQREQLDLYVCDYVRTATRLAIEPRAERAKSVLGSLRMAWDAFTHRDAHAKAQEQVTNAERNFVVIACLTPSIPSENLDFMCIMGDDQRHGDFKALNFTWRLTCEFKKNAFVHERYALGYDVSSGVATGVPAHHIVVQRLRDLSARYM